MVFTWCKGRNGLRKRNKYTDSWAKANCFGSIDQGLKEQDCKIGGKEDWGERHVHRSHGSGHKACGSSCFPSMSTRKCPPQWSHWKTTWIEWLEHGRSSRPCLQPAPCLGIVPINGVTMGAELESMDGKQAEEHKCWELEKKLRMAGRTQRSWLSITFLEFTILPITSHFSGIISSH